jgi:PAS domain S-box-containing protein
MEIDQKASETAENRRAFLNDEVYYKDIVEGQTELICRFNSDDDLTFVNDAFCKYFQLKRKDLIGQSFMDLIHEEDREVFQALLSSLDRKNPIATAENRVTLPNRDVLWQQWAIRAIFDNKGIIVEYQSVGRDVTERMLAEADLRDCENNFRALVENAADGIIMVGAEGNVIYANRCFAETSGYNIDELLTFGFEKLIDPSDREILADRLRRRLKGENVSQNHETILITKAGRAVPVEANGAKTIWQGDPVGLIIIRDITLRKELEKSLRMSEHDFREMAENVRDGILLSAGDGDNVYANNGFARISGYTVSELLKLGFKDLVHANEHEKITKRYFNRIAGKKVPNHYETKIVRKDGKIVPLGVSASKTVWHNQTAVMGIYRDISERKKIEVKQKKFVVILSAWSMNELQN